MRDATFNKILRTFQRKDKILHVFVPSSLVKRSLFPFTHQMSSRHPEERAPPLCHTHAHARRMCAQTIARRPSFLHSTLNNLFPFRLGNKVIRAEKKKYVGGDLTVFVGEDSALFKHVVTQCGGMSLWDGALEALISIMGRLASAVMGHQGEINQKSAHI